MGVEKGSGRCRPLPFLFVSIPQTGCGMVQCSCSLPLDNSIPYSMREAEREFYRLSPEGSGHNLPQHATLLFECKGEDCAV